MKILLLGKDGQVGWELQRSLAPLGELRACGRRECDLGKLDRLRAVVRDFRPQVIVNAAAYTAVDKAESEIERAMRINGEAPGVLAAEAAELGALLVHYSTDYVFDGTKDAPYVETDPTGPQGAYGRSKLAGEAAIHAAGGRALILRTSWVFGAHGGNFVKTILRLARERESLNVVADQIGSPTPAALIADVTALAVALLRGGEAMGPAEQRTYHLAADGPVSWHRFAREIVSRAADLPGMGLRLRPEAIQAIPSSDYPTPAKRPANSRLDCRRLEEDFNLRLPSWEPYLDRLLEGLAAAPERA